MQLHQFKSIPLDLSLTHIHSLLLMLLQYPQIPKVRKCSFNGLKIVSQLKKIKIKIKKGENLNGYSQHNLSLPI